MTGDGRGAAGILFLLLGVAVVTDAKQMMTPEQVKVASSSNLAAVKAMVPSEVATDAIGMGEWGEQPLLSFAIIYHKCTDEGHATVQYLIDQGASPNQENKLGYSPIHPAAWRNDMKVIKMCEKAGADMNHITKTGWSTLTCSLKNPNSDLAHIEPTMAYLIEKGPKIDPKAVDMEGATPLHHAAMWGTAKTVAKLIEKGWDPLLKDKTGKTPADYAKMCKPAPVDVELARCEEVKMFLDAFVAYGRQSGWKLKKPVKPMMGSGEAEGEAEAEG